MTSSGTRRFRAAPFQEWLVEVAASATGEQSTADLVCMGFAEPEILAAVERLCVLSGLARTYLAVTDGRAELVESAGHTAELARATDGTLRLAGRPPAVPTVAGGLHVRAARDGRRWRLRLAAPSLLADARTMSILQRSLAQLLLAEPVGERPAGDAFRYAEWQHLLASRREPPTTPGHTALRPALLIDRTTGDGPTPHAVTHPLPAGTVAAVEEMARQQGIAPEAVVLGAWRAMLGVLCQTRAADIDVALDDRRGSVPESVCGQLSPRLTWGTQWSSGTTLRDHATDAGAWLSETQRRQPLWHPGSAPTSPSELAFQRVPPGFTLCGNGTRIDGPAPWPGSLGATLLLTAALGGPGQQLGLVHDGSRIDHRDAADLLTELARLLDRLAGTASQVYTGTAAPPAAATTAERRPAALWNRVVRYAEDRPDAIAVDSASESVTYAELIARARAAAGRLRASGLGTDDPVAVLLPESSDLVAAILGVLAAGGAFVPLSESLPPARIEAMLRAAGCRRAVTDERLGGLLPSWVESVAAAGPVDTPFEPAGVRPDALAYILFTSGTTGVPKGVQVTRRGLDSYVDWTVRAYPFRSGNCVISHSAPTFDLTLTTLLAPLAAGQRVRLVPSHRSVDLLPAAIREAGDVGLLKLTPSHLALLIQAAARLGDARIRSIVVGGENFPADLLAAWRRLRPECVVFNEYGPTETVVGCTAHRAEGDAGFLGVPIGAPISGARAYVLDTGLRPLIAGVAGELYVSGHGVSRGYAGRPGETAARFLPDPWGPAGSRMYRTGDLAARTASDGLRFLGRTDRQVKIHGHRIEPAEIEAQLRGLDGVADAAVQPVTQPNGDSSLAAYVVAAPGATVDESELATALATRLPAYLIPGVIVPVSTLPLTANGKLAAEALRQPATPIQASRPATPTQELVRGIWSEVLCLPEPDLDTRFFDLGGTSFSLAKVAVRLRRALDRDLHLATLLEFPTIRTLAGHLESPIDGGAEGTRADADDRVEDRRDQVARLRRRQEAVR